MRWGWVSLRSESSLGLPCWMSVRNLASTFRRMRDERWESGWGCCFWGRSDTHLAGDEAIPVDPAPLAPLEEVTDEHGGESLAEWRHVGDLVRQIDDD